MAKAGKTLAKRAAAKKSKPAITRLQRSKKNIKKSFLAELCIELEKASQGLTYPSETDSPFEFFSIRQPNLTKSTDLLTGDVFLAGIGLSGNVLSKLKIAASQLIEERDFNTFLPGIKDIAQYYGTDINDPEVKKISSQYRNLEKLLKNRLGNVKLFRVGVIDIRCYICGFVKGNNIAGLLTTSVET